MRALLPLLSILPPRPWTSVYLALGLVALAAGCGGSDRTPVHPVHGRVVLNGQPVPNALVVLHPLSEQAKETPRPRAQATVNGAFALGTYDAQDGAPAGEYAVTVECWLTSRRGGDDAPSNHLPHRYSRPETSGLRVRVQPGDNELSTIQLTK